MYLQARVFIKTALAQLVLAVLLGAYFLIDSGLRLNSYPAALLPVYYHLLMVGWITQLIAGVALWMFPPFSREQPRGDERLGWFVYGALNAGLLLRAISEPVQYISPTTWSSWGLAIAALLQVAAIWVLVIVLWPRVKGKPDPARLRKERS